MMAGPGGVSALCAGDGSSGKEVLWAGGLWAAWVRVTTARFRPGEPGSPGGGLGEPSPLQPWGETCAPAAQWFVEHVEGGLGRTASGSCSCISQSPKLQK